MASTRRSTTSCASCTRKKPLCRTTLCCTTLRRTPLRRTTRPTAEQGKGQAQAVGEVLTSVVWLRCTPQRRSEFPGYLTVEQHHVWRAQQHGDCRPGPQPGKWPLSGMPCSGKNLQSLLPERWLSDGVINAYIDMLQAQARCDPNYRLLGTHRYVQLSGDGHYHARRRG
jgi:hypothetical protein